MNEKTEKTLKFEVTADGKIIKTAQLLKLWDEPKHIDPSRLRRPSGIAPVWSPDIDKTAELLSRGGMTPVPLVVFCDPQGHYWQASDFDRKALLERCKIPLATMMHAHHGTEDDARQYAILTGHATATGEAQP